MNSFSRLYQYIIKYKVKIGLSIVANILLSVFTVFSIPLLIPFFQILFDRGITDTKGQNSMITEMQLAFQNYAIQHGKQDALMSICIVIIVTFFLRNLFRYLALYFMAPVRTGIVRDIRSALFRKYTDLPLSFYAEEKKGDLLSRALSDVQEIEWSVLNALEAIFKSPFIILGSVVFMLMVSLKLCLFVFILLLFTAFIIGGISRTLKKESAQVQSRLGAITSILEESISGLRVIKAFNGEPYQTKKFDKENQAYKKSLTTLLWRRDLSVPLSEFLGVTVVTVLLYYGTIMVFKNQLMPEVFFSFVFAFYQIIEPAKSFSSAWYNVQKGLAALDRVHLILDTEPAIKQEVNALEIFDFKNEIVFDNVGFSYNNSDKAAIKNINFTIKKGESIALVGPSGGGKSTLIDLLARFQDCSSGRILIDGIDIKSLKIDHLRSLLGIVTQEPILFNDSIKNNILFGRNFNDEDIQQAVDAADAKEFIDKLPNGINTNTGDRGMKLSGGQKQRLTIARALLANPPILLLDEATSSLDSESEKFVQLALDKMMVGRTSIVIAHRLSTVASCDRILVIAKGELVETGNHTQLMSRMGSYYNLVMNQMSDQGRIE